MTNMTSALPAADAAAESLRARQWEQSIGSVDATDNSCGSHLLGGAGFLMWALRPLERMLEQATGDPAGLYQASMTWETHCGTVQAVSTDVQRILRHLGPDNQSFIAVAVSHRVKAYASATHSIANWSKVASQTLQTFVRIVELMRAMVCRAIELAVSAGSGIGEVIFGSWPWEIDKKIRAMNSMTANIARIVKALREDLQRFLQLFRELFRLLLDLYRAIVPFHDELEAAIGAMITIFPPGNVPALQDLPDQYEPGTTGDVKNPGQVPFPGSDQRFSKHYPLGYAHRYDLGATSLSTDALNKKFRENFGHAFLPSRVGDNSQLNMQLTGPGQVIKTSLFGLNIPEVTAGDIKVTQVTDDGFVIMARSGHPEYPGEVAFRIRNIDGHATFEVSGVYESTTLDRLRFQGNTNTAYANISDIAIWADMKYRLEDLFKYGS